MGDFQEMMKAMRETHRLKRAERRKSFWLEVASWLGALGALYAVWRILYG